MPHPSWSGSVRLSLVSFGVRGYTSIEAEKGAISLNQLHKDCHSRIRYKKTCEIHGEVPNDEIVMGYNYGGDNYVVVDPEELDALRTEADKSITIDKFVPPSEIDPIYLSGQTYFLVPDGKQSAKPYAVMQKAMTDEKVWGIATVVITSREKLVVIRPIGHLLTASVLHYAATVRQPELFDVPETSVLPQELKLAKTLIDASTVKQADLEAYRDLYVERLNELVQAKMSGKKLTSPTKSKTPPVFNFMEALKASVDKKKARGTAIRRKPPTTRPAARRRKSG